MNARPGFHWNATKILAAGFAAIILLGAGLLSLPAANRSGESIPFLNALFTSGSATCVTGLVMYDTWSQFTLFGQMVIMLLIQIGGLGFMTIAILFSMALGRKIGLRERYLLAEAVNSLQIGGVVRLVKHILIGTFACEGMGALLLSVRFVPQMGLWQGLWYGVFHSVSAFCNAGFDLMGCYAPFASLTPFYNDPLVSLTIAFLLIAGGVGFVVWDDVFTHGFRIRRYKLHSRVVLVTTLALILLGTGLFLLFEYNATFAGMPFGEKLLCAFFQAITPRTAGFNTVDTAALSEGGRLLTMALMFIGAGPGSTAGGIKVSTLFVMLAALFSYMRGRDTINTRSHRLEPELVLRAYCSVALYAVLVIIGCFLLTASSHLAAEEAAFEAISAMGTVGLSTGVTRSLSALSRVGVILLMYAGRVGSLTVFLAVAESRRGGGKVKNPVGKIIIG